MSARPRFVGRDAAARRIAELLDRAEAGRLTLVLIEGPPGSGKSRLLERSVSIAQRHGAWMVPDRDWIHDTGPWHRQLVPPAAVRSVVLTCEDPPAIDPRVWPVLRAIARTVPVSVVVARRAGADVAALDQLSGSTVHRIGLAPLPPEAVAQLLTAVLGAAPDPGLARLSQVAAGNPRAVLELVAGVREERLVSVVDGQATLLVPRLPGRTRARLAAELAALSPAARRLLRVASTIGTAFELRELTHLMREGAATLLPVVDEVIASGLVAAAGDGLRFTHDLVRAEVEASLPRAVRVALREERSASGTGHPTSPPARATASTPRTTGAGRAAPIRYSDTGLAGAWASLTEQEQAISRLVGQALTNQQIATRIDRSPHTVNYHLRQIFRKLAISSRVELARVASQHADAAAPLAADHG